MKIATYISGIIGVILLILGVIGIIAEFWFSNYLFLSAGILIGLVFTPLAILDRYRHNKKIKNILRSYKEKPPKIVQSGATVQKSSGIDFSSNHTRKYGLTWGGGNIHGANASRGSKRTFLRK